MTLPPDTPEAGAAAQAPAAQGGSGPFIGSAADYLARSDSLLEAARTAEPGLAAGLEAEAREWRKLAIVADWQEVMQFALAAVHDAPASKA